MNARLRRLAYRGLVLLAAAELALLVVSGVVARTLITPRPSAVGPPPAGLVAESVAGANGVMLATWLTESLDAPSYVAVLAHGKGGTRDAMRARIELHRERGAAVVAYDARGHGLSSMSALTFGRLESLDQAAIVAHAAARWPDTPILVHGISLGAVAALNGGASAADAVLAEQTFTTLDEAIGMRLEHRLGPLAPIVHAHMRLSAPRALGSPDWNVAPIDAVGSLEPSVLYLAGAEDWRAPARSSERLSRATRDSGGVVVIEGAGHDDLLDHDQERFEAALDQLLDGMLEDGASRPRR